MKTEVNMTMLEKDAGVQYTVKSIASFQFYSEIPCLLFSMLLLDDSVVIEIKILVASMGDLPEQRGN